jgi:hypothetical protein
MTSEAEKLVELTHEQQRLLFEARRTGRVTYRDGNFHVELGADAWNATYAPALQPFTSA